MEQCKKLKENKGFKNKVCVIKLYEQYYNKIANLPINNLGNRSEFIICLVYNYCM